MNIHRHIEIELKKQEDLEIMKAANRLWSLFHDVKLVINIANKYIDCR